MNEIIISPELTQGEISRDIFGGFAEHLGRCIYGGIYEPGSPLADENGFRTDVMSALERLNMPVIRYPGGNFASGYRWMDGVGPRADRPARMDLAWNTIEPNHFGTNEFIDFCRRLDTEPYLVVNCGDGDMREARDWVEYCNGTQETALVKLRRRHGYEKPHRVKYWGIGNEVDGSWQIGYKTPAEYARAYTEFAKVMKWTDPDIKLLASAVSFWDGDIAERTQLLIEQAGEHIDYMALHWYVGNPNDDYAAYMCVSELIEGRLNSYEELLRTLSLEKELDNTIPIAVDEWNVWYRTHPRQGGIPSENKLEEKYNLEDALVVAMHFNAFIRHARTVKMANIAQIVNVIAPVFTGKDGLVLQTIFYPFELFSSTCGKSSLYVEWEGDTFSSGEYSGQRDLDVSATLDESGKKLTVYVVNRNKSEDRETSIQLTEGEFGERVRVITVNGPDIKSVNTFDAPDEVTAKESALTAGGNSLTYTFEPHSVTALIADIR